jgi:hypothetical protein
VRKNEVEYLTKHPTLGKFTQPLQYLKYFLFFHRTVAHIKEDKGNIAVLNAVLSTHLCDCSSSTCGQCATTSHKLAAIKAIQNYREELKREKWPHLHNNSNVDQLLISEAKHFSKNRIMVGTLAN